MKAPRLLPLVVAALITSVDQPLCHAQMFQTAKPLPSSSEGKVYNTGSFGVKTGNPTRVIETGKDGVSKVYNTGSFGVKTGNPVQVIDSKR